MSTKTNEHNAARNHTKRNGSSVISLTKFAHSKSEGTKRAIERYRKKKVSKFKRNASLLREYKKAMKSEGFEAGKGASRKRNQEKDSVSVDENVQQEKPPKKKAKSDPFAKARQRAQLVMEEKDKQKVELQERLKEKEAKEKQKRAKAKKLVQRTKKGQPIMKHIIGDMLEKIQAKLET